MLWLTPLGEEDHTEESEQTEFVKKNFWTDTGVILHGRNYRISSSD